MHLYMLGKTGVGKSTVIETLALQDLALGRGFALIDPHGDLAERVWAAASTEVRKRIAYLDAPDPAQVFGYNPLRRVRDDKMAKEFQPTFRIEDLLSLPNRGLYVKLMIDGSPSRPFSANTIAPGSITAH
jgi:hypothetical protein